MIGSWLQSQLLPQLAGLKVKVSVKGKVFPVVPQLGSTFSLMSSPQLQITVSSPMAAPLLLRFSIPGLNTAATPSVVFLARQTSAGEEIDSLLPIGGNAGGGF